MLNWSVTISSLVNLFRISAGFPLAYSIFHATANGSLMSVIPTIPFGGASSTPRSVSSSLFAPARRYSSLVSRRQSQRDSYLPRTGWSGLVDRPWPESNSSLCTRPQRPGNLRPRRGPPVISALPRQECRHRTGCCVRSSADGTTPCPRLRASSTGAAMMARTRSRNVGTSSLVNPLVSMVSCR